MIELFRHVAILDSEIEMTAIRAQGPGGQHVNKTSTAVHLRFDIRASNLPEFYKQRLLNASHHLITREGIVVIKAQSSRRLALNREAAIERLVSLIKELTIQQKSRKPTKPGRAVKLRRRNEKSQKSTVKALRNRVEFD